MFAARICTLATALFLVACGDGGGAQNNEPMPVDWPPVANISEPDIVVEYRNESGEVRFGDGQSMTSAELDDLFGEDVFTIAMPVMLDERPHDRMALISNWRLEDEERSFEIGVDAWQRPYITLSDDGTFDEGASDIVFPDGQLRVGVRTLLVVRVEPGVEATIFIGGLRVGWASLKSSGLHPSDAEVVIGARPSVEGVKHQFSGALGDIRGYASALSDDQIDELSQGPDVTHGKPIATPVTPLTSGPPFHWFGYYDKFQSDPTDRYFLSMQVDFENRSPVADDTIRIGYIDTQNDFEWTEIGTSSAWNWQQGCMLQWRPGSDTEIVWNDREDGAFVTRIYDMESGETRTLPAPLYTIAPDGKTALGLDFARLAHMRPGYGYKGVPDPNFNELTPPESTIYELDLDTGEVTTVLRLDEIAEIPNDEDTSGQKHYVNVIQYTPDGEKFSVFHRWWREGGGFGTRILVSDLQGEVVSVLSDDRGLSHSVWRDPEWLLVWTWEFGGYTLYSHESGKGETILKRQNGHQLYLPDQRWMVSDTYPTSNGTQLPFLYDIERDEIFLLGAFPSPPDYRGEWRVDNHPRLSRDGTKVIIDSAHQDGRQQYMIDVAEVLNWTPPD